MTFLVTDSTRHWLNISNLVLRNIKVKWRQCSDYNLKKTFSKSSPIMRTPVEEFSNCFFLNCQTVKFWFLKDFLLEQCKQKCLNRFVTIWRDCNGPNYNTCSAKICLFCPKILKSTKRRWYYLYFVILVEK